MRDRLPVTLLAGLLLAGCAESRPPIPEGPPPPPAPGLASLAAAPAAKAPLLVRAEGDSVAAVEAALLREAARATLRDGREHFRIASREIEPQGWAGRRRPVFGGFGIGVGLGDRDGVYGRYGLGFPFGRHDPWRARRHGAYDLAYEGVAEVVPVDAPPPDGPPGEGVPPGELYEAESTLIVVNRILGGR